MIQGHDVFLIGILFLVYGELHSIDVDKLAVKATAFRLLSRCWEMRMLRTFWEVPL